jgi:hypothetical protein
MWSPGMWSSGRPGVSRRDSNHLKVKVMKMTDNQAFVGNKRILGLGSENNDFVVISCGGKMMGRRIGE